MNDRMSCNDNVVKSCGIYKIVNTLNGKIYIGKTLNFKKRYHTYNSAIRKQNVKQINRRFLNSILKHGVGNFEFSVVEECDVDSLADRELYWMEYYESTNVDKGYNLRMDSSTKMIVHELTRKKISERVNREYADGTRSREAFGEMAKEMWKDTEKLDHMRHSVSESKRSYFIQRKRCGEILVIWDGINHIINNNPSYKWQNIYAACNGSKKSYKGYLWERIDKDSLDDSLLPLVSTLENSLTDYYSNKVDCESVLLSGQHKVCTIYEIHYADGMVEELFWKSFSSKYPGVLAKMSRKKSDEVVMYGLKFIRRPYEHQTKR